MKSLLRFVAFAVLACGGLAMIDAPAALAQGFVYPPYYTGPYYAGTAVTYRRPLLGPRTVFYPGAAVYAAPTVVAYPSSAAYYAAPTVTGYPATTAYYGGTLYTTPTVTAYPGVTSYYRAPVAPLPVPAVSYPLPTLVYPPAVFP